MSFSAKCPGSIAAVFLVLAGLLGTVAAAEDKILTASISSSTIPAQLTQDFGRVLQGQPVVLTITVSNQRDKPLTIGAVQPTCACMSEKSDRAIPPGKSGTVSLRLETPDYSGPVTEAALIQWVDAPVAVTRVELKLDVTPVLQVLPKKLVRFRTVRGTASQQVVELRTADGKPFTVTGVDTSTPFLKAAVTASGAGVYRVAITLGAEAPTGMLKEAVTVHTDLPTLPSVKLSVTGLVAEAGTRSPAPGNAG